MGAGWGARGRLAMEHALERWRNPSLPSQIEISPTPGELAPSSKREPLLPQAEVTQPIADVPAKALERGALVSSPDSARKKVLPETQSRVI